MMSFIKDWNVGYFYNSFKPRTHVIDLALGVMNIRRDEAVLIGDQLFTDILAANRSEIKAFLVKPIGNKSTLFIKLKSFIERKILK
jgi:predicted HAD superfamily phosphohydrolase YqeG